MNLPMIAVEFLDCFIGAFKLADKEIWTVDGAIKLPIIHVYGFTVKAEPEACKANFVERIGKAMQYPEFKGEDIISFHQIRDVSGTSHMFSTSFKLPEQVAFSDIEYKDVEIKRIEIEKEREALVTKNAIYKQFEDADSKKKAKLN
jgi:hypothetical protein